MENEHPRPTCATPGCIKMVASAGKGRLRKICNQCHAKKYYTHRVRPFCAASNCNNLAKKQSAVGKWYKFCAGCQRERQGKPRKRDFVEARKRQLKGQAVAYLGGVCQNVDCFIPKSVNLPAKAFDFHHRDPTTKTANIAAMIRDGLGWQIIKTELDKCDLLCCLCHRLV